MRNEGPPASAEVLRKRIVARHAVRLHCAVILLACFGVGALVTKLLLMAGVDAMWVRYAFALGAAYLTFLLGVRIWLHYAGFHRSSRDWAEDALDVADLPFPRRGPDADAGAVFRGGGGRSGGGGGSGRFDLDGEASPRIFEASSHGGSSGGGGFDLDDGWVLLALVAVVLAVSGAVVWLIYAAPTILADAGFAALLSAGLVKSTRRMSGEGWMGSVVGNTWLPFTVVFVLAMTFAIVAQHHLPDARTLADVLRRR